MERATAWPKGKNTWPLQKKKNMSFKGFLFPIYAISTSNKTKETAVASDELLAAGGFCAVMGEKNAFFEQTKRSFGSENVRKSKIGVSNCVPYLLLCYIVYTLPFFGNALDACFGNQHVGWVRHRTTCVNSFLVGKHINDTSEEFRCT